MSLVPGAVECGGGELAVGCVVCDHKREVIDVDGLALLWFSGLWVVISPAPLLATAETEDQFLGLPRFLPVRNPGDEPRATDWHRVYRPDLLIAPAAAVTHSAPSPSPPSLPR
ncbi:MAG: hypothetical protein GY832_16955 [Chloroflexi bacterium]|nr:hypothetical protein [Chloroflexota bacterium]